MTQVSTPTRDGLRVVGIGEMLVSSTVEESLVTYSLGSCIGVTVYDPGLRVGGLIHCMLPMSKLEPTKAQERPCMFVDTGMIELLNAVLELGADKSRLIVKVAGAASPMDPNGRFKIGERNHTTLRKVLWKNEIMLAAEQVGGSQPRTLTLHIADGRTTIRSGSQETEL